MTDPKRRIRGLPDLGRAIDERIRARSGKLVLRHDTGKATPAPLSSGGSAGGSGGTGGPAFPESCVVSVRLNDGGTKRTGNIVLEHGGVGALTENAAPSGDRCFCWQGASVLSVASLPQSPDTEIIYRRTSDGTLWWHDGSVWIELTASEMRYDRQTFPAAGNADGGAYDINVHWAAEAVDEIELAEVAAASKCVFAQSPGDTGVGMLSGSHARFSWTSGQEAGLVVAQARLYAGTTCRRSCEKADAYARVRINDASRLGALYLSLSDTSSPANSSATNNLAGSLSGNTWAEIELADVAINQWGAYLRLCLTAEGTLAPEDTGETIFDLESLSLEQWAS